MSTDLDAAVARLEERCRHGELRRVGVVSADVRLLLADWKRLREMTSPAAGLARLEQELGIMDKTIAERDAARAEVERLKKLNEDLLTYQELGGTCAYCKATHLKEEMPAHIEQCAKHPMAAMKAELDRLRERDARAREAFGLIDWMAKEYAEAGGSSGPEMRAYNEAIALLKETP